jgi:hypothetical protein
MTPDPITPERLEAEGFTKRIAGHFLPLGSTVELCIFCTAKKKWHGELWWIDKQVKLPRTFETMPDILNLITVLKGAK